MNTLANTSLGSDIASKPIASAPISAAQQFYWSLRREVWENRSIYIAPIAVAMVELFGFFVSLVGMPHRRRAVLLLEPRVQQAAIEMPYVVAALMLLVTAFLVAVFYSLDALYGERRERSILFWKSLPVSDLTTVLSKATIPLVVLPILTLATIIVTQVTMLLVSSVVLLLNGISPSTTLEHFPFFQQLLMLAYALVVMALWYAPIYGWLLLVSGWVRRAPFLWAVLPVLAIGILEKIAFNTTHFVALVRERVFGWINQAFAFTFKNHGSITLDSFAHLTPGKFLALPALWIGLAFAIAFIVTAIRLRRYRGPL